MFRKDHKNMPKALGVAYIVSQCIGAFLASILLIFFTDNGMENLVVLRHCFLINPLTGEKTKNPIDCYNIPALIN